MAFLAVLVQLVFLVSVSRVHLSVASRILAEPVQQQQPLLQYHHGPLLSGPISLNLIWYGHFSPSQRAIVADFLTSLSSPAPHNHPSVSTWWKTIHNYYAKTPKTPSLRLNLGTQILDEGCSLGKTLKSTNLLQLAGGGQRETAVNIVLTAPDVAVEGFCTSRCGTHGSSSSSQATGERFAYIWVGNSETQCPGQCAWPFHQPVYGPQSPPLVAPNGDAGVDGMVVTLAGLLAGTATNPFGSGYFQGAATAPLEAASACAGMYGKGAYPGYAGTVLVDESGGGSYNAHGVNGRKYLLPALYDPSTSSCTTLV